MFRKLLYRAFTALGSREALALERDSRDPGAAQLSRLLDIVSTNADTVYGRKHNFSSIKTPADFQAAVPVNKYEDLSSYISSIADGQQSVLTKEQPFMFATTSGTTGARKMIPVTRSYLKEFRRASIASGYHQIKNFPQIAKGIILSVFSPAEEGRTAAQIPYGAISGRLYLEEPPLIKRYVSPIPYEVFLIDDYESRYYTLLRLGLVLPVTVFYTLNPSTIMMLARRLSIYAKELIADIENGTVTPPRDLPAPVRASLAGFLKPEPARARELRALLDQERLIPTAVWPDLCVISCWTKAAASFYLQDLHQHFAGVPVCDITYGASEGRGTVSISPSEQMLAIRSHFFEFMPVSDPEHSPLLAHELEAGESYSILFTTSAGLYRYDINDIVKVSGFHNRTPLLEFMHKKGNVSSFTGEKVTESQVTEALSRASAKLDLKVRFFTVVPEFRPEPHYQLWFELDRLGGEAIDDLPVDLGQPSTGLDERCERLLAQAFDQELSVANSEYEAKRKSKRLADVSVKRLASGSYELLRKSLVARGVPDAQVKISHLNPKDDIKEFLERQIKSAVT